MHRYLGLILISVTAGCQWGTPCGGSSCGPVVCVEHHCYCRKLDDLHTGMSARLCALQAFPGREGCDYRRGFTQAYVDVALGRTGTAPPVPPERYWDVCFRSGCGQGRAADWYAGYRDGAAHAQQRCGTTCRTVPSSGTGYHHGPVRAHGPAHDGMWSAGGLEAEPVSPCHCQRY